MKKQSLLKIFAVVLSTYVLSIQPAIASALSDPQGIPYTLKGTEIISTPAPKLGREYEVFISLPQNYEKSNKRYPALFVTDANYGFPVIRAIADRVSRLGVGLEDFILVGLSYAKGEDGTASRNRDYTFHRSDTKNNRDLAQGAVGYGQANAYLDFLVRDVFPMLEAKYRIDPNRRIYVGHSYGSLLGLEALFNQPKLFSHYILGSPSLWYDKPQVFDMERRYAAQHGDLPVKIQFFIGSYEAVKAGNSRYNKSNDMVADLDQFVTQMRSHHYKGLELKSTVLNDEDHATVFPALITRGLMWALPATR